MCSLIPPLCVRELWIFRKDIEMRLCASTAHSMVLIMVRVVMFSHLSNEGNQLYFTLNHEISFEDEGLSQLCGETLNVVASASMCERRQSLACACCLGIYMAKNFPPTLPPANQGLRISLSDKQIPPRNFDLVQSQRGGSSVLFKFQTDFTKLECSHEANCASECVLLSCGLERLLEGSDTNSLKSFLS